MRPRCPSVRISSLDRSCPSGPEPRACTKVIPRMTACTAPVLSPPRMPAYHPLDQRRPHRPCPRSRAGAPTRNSPIRIGVIGSGEMGTDLVTQGMLMRGVEVAAIATRRPHTALEATAIAYGDTSHAVEADTLSKVSAAIGQKKLAITSADTLVRTPEIDVVIDATGKPGVAADFDLLAMEHGKHLVMMNVEADVTIGPYLKQRGRSARRRLFRRRRRRAELLHGADRVRHARSAIASSPPARARTTPSTATPCPTTIAKKPTRRNMNPRMLVEFVDGSKTMVEMALHRQRHRPRARRSGHARPRRRPRPDGQGADPQGGRRHPRQEGRRRLHRRQGRRARRVRDRRGRAPAHHRAHGRSACRQRARTTPSSAPTI